MARQIRLPRRALEILEPVIHPPRGPRPDATPRELLDYAGGLIGLGLTLEVRAVTGSSTFNASRPRR